MTARRASDGLVAGLIRDLKARGLFDETLLIWSGEFGRTPHYQDLQDGAGDADDPDFATMRGMGLDFESHRAALAARTGRRPMSPERIARWLDCGAQGSIALGEDGQAKDPLDQPALDWSRKQIAESKARIAAAEKREAAEKPPIG